MAKPHIRLHRVMTESGRMWHAEVVRPKLPPSKVNFYFLPNAIRSALGRVVAHNRRQPDYRVRGTP